MCDNHATTGQPETPAQHPPDMAPNDFIRLAQNDRDAAMALFLKEVPQAYTDPANRLLMAQAFDGYLALLQEQAAETSLVH